MLAFTSILAAITLGSLYIALARLPSLKKKKKGTLSVRITFSVCLTLSYDAIGSFSRYFINFEIHMDIGSILSSSTK